MNTDKKNQHYLPKFYLRYFSYNKNDKQIGIFNIHKGFYFPTAALKKQGSKNFFYGHDGTIEDTLSDIEGRLATLIRNIITSYKLPIKNSNAHIELLLFVILTHLRNPVTVEGMKQNRELMKKRLLEESPQSKLDDLIPNIPHEQAIEISLSAIKSCIENTTDLHYKLLRNITSTDFITSDFPIVKYNSFLERKKWALSKTGYGTIGLEIFIPLSPKLILVFFDSGIYKIGNKKDILCDISNSKDVDQLNLLQVLNCTETIFFNENITKSYVEQLVIKSKNFQRANILTAEMNYLYKPGENVNTKKKNKDLIIMGSTDCEINLEIEPIKMHAGAKKAVITERAVQLRRLPEMLSKHGR